MIDCTVKRPPLPRLLLALLAGGCAWFRPKPPAFNLHGRQRVAILPFANATADPAAAGALQDALADGLAGLKACPVARPGESTGGADLLLRGTVERYEESVRPEAPKRIRSFGGEGEWKWGRAETCRAAVSASATLIDAATGAVVWTRRADASHALSRWNDLPWPGDQEKPPKDEAGAGPATSGATVYTADRVVARAREEAVLNLTRALLHDFHGAPGWEPPSHVDVRSGKAGSP